MTKLNQKTTNRKGLVHRKVVRSNLSLTVHMIEEMKIIRMRQRAKILRNHNRALVMKNLLLMRVDKAMKIAVLMMTQKK